jgi:hypothetical protein
MPSQDEASPPDDLFEGVNFEQVKHLTRAFDIMADRLGGISNSTAMWALAALVSKVLASATDFEGAPAATSQRFAEMLRAAYPATVKALEAAKRQHDGRRQFDA